jgi:hypothetical protein
MFRRRKRQRKPVVSTASREMEPRARAIFFPSGEKAGALPIPSTSFHAAQRGNLVESLGRVIRWISRQTRRK